MTDQKETPTEAGVEEKIIASCPSCKQLLAVYISPGSNPSVVKPTLQDLLDALKAHGT